MTDCTCPQPFTVAKKRSVDVLLVAEFIDKNVKNEYVRRLIVLPTDGTTVPIELQSSTFRNATASRAEDDLSVATTLEPKYTRVGKAQFLLTYTEGVVPVFILTSGTFMLQPM